MKIPPTFLRLGLAAALIGSLGACTVVPTYSAGYPSRPVYVETYPTYVYPGTSIYYQSGGHRHPYHDGYRGRYFDDHRQIHPLPPPMRLHRDIRRGLDLPRPPGLR